MTSVSTLGVGILGSGPVTQAIHLPALAQLTDLFTVRTVMDVSQETAQSVAARVGARATTLMGDLLEDDTVDVVAVCSPHQFHADQVIAACRAGKRAVLCEKPFATTAAEASQISEVSAETGVPILVGAMHAYDPGWLAFLEAWGPTRGSADHVRCSIVLPPNPRFEDFATEVSNRMAPPTLPRAESLTEARADLLRGGILGLAIHDLPLIRAFLTTTDDIVVHTARTLTPFGYLVVFSCGDQVVELHAHMSETWNPNWVLQVYTSDRVGSVEFTPSYVQAGSAVATISTPDRQVRLGPKARNGYIEEWQHLYDVAHGEAPRYRPQELIADLTFALDLSDRAAAALATTPEFEGAR
jgi:myo-inositol 2-dehydrogenase / D-chiro-inositol 1-dehydrogenase